MYTTINCLICAEPWESDSIRVNDVYSDMAKWERELFQRGAGCNCCGGPSGSYSMPSHDDKEQFATKLAEILCACPLETLARVTVPKWEKPADPPCKHSCHSCGAQAVWDEEIEEHYWVTSPNDELEASDYSEDEIEDTDFVDVGGHSHCASCASLCEDCELGFTSEDLYILDDQAFWAQPEKRCMECHAEKIWEDEREHDMSIIETACHDGLPDASEFKIVVTYVDETTQVFYVDAFDADEIMDEYYTGQYITRMHEQGYHIAHSDDLSEVIMCEVGHDKKVLRSEVWEGEYHIRHEPPFAGYEHVDRKYTRKQLAEYLETVTWYVGDTEDLVYCVATVGIDQIVSDVCEFEKLDMSGNIQLDDEGIAWECHNAVVESLLYALQDYPVDESKIRANCINCPYGVPRNVFKVVPKGGE